MCKNVVLIPEKNLDTGMQKKICKTTLVWSAWQATRRALNLQHAPVRHFASSQWQQGSSPPRLYVIYRWLVFVGVISIAIASFACQNLPRHYKGPVKLNYFKWFIYFTNWGYMTIVLQAGLALAVLHRYRDEIKLNIACEEEESGIPHRTRTPLLCRGYWLAHIIATDLAFVITLVYWMLVHDPKIHEVNTLNVLVHAGNSVLMLCELAVTAHPLRIAHALYGAAAGLIYGVFSAFYWACGGTDRVGLSAIYPSLDWNKPGPALGFVALCAIVMIFAHAIATLLVVIRTHIAAKVYSSRRHNSLTLPIH